MPASPDDHHGPVRVDGESRPPQARTRDRRVAGPPYPGDGGPPARSMQRRFASGGGSALGSGPVDPAKAARPARSPRLWSSRRDPGAPPPAGGPPFSARARARGRRPRARDPRRPARGSPGPPSTGRARRCHRGRRRSGDPLARACRRSSTSRSTTWRSARASTTRPAPSSAASSASPALAASKTTPLQTTDRRPAGRRNPSTIASPRARRRATWAREQPGGPSSTENISSTVGAEAPCCIVRLRQRRGFSPGGLQPGQLDRDERVQEQAEDQKRARRDGCGRTPGPTNHSGQPT